MAETTTVNENARLELLRMLALLQDMGAGDEHWPEWTPLFECEWKNDADDIILAMREATALGHVESNALHATNDPAARIIANLRGGREWMVRITPAGYAWIRAQDAVGESAQDAAARQPGAGGGHG